MIGIGENGLLCMSETRAPWDFLTCARMTLTTMRVANCNYTYYTIYIPILTVVVMQTMSACSPEDMYVVRTTCSIINFN